MKRSNNEQRRIVVKAEGEKLLQVEKNCNTFESKNFYTMNRTLFENLLIIYAIYIITSLYYTAVYF